MKLTNGHAGRIRRNPNRFSPARLLGTGAATDWIDSFLGEGTGKTLIDAGVNRAVGEIVDDDGNVIGTTGASSSAPVSKPFLKTPAGMITLGVGGIVAVMLVMKLAGGKKRRRR